jgi:hypothetical protein
MSIIISGKIISIKQSRSHSHGLTYIGWIRNLLRYHSIDKIYIKLSILIGFIYPHGYLYFIEINELSSCGKHYIIHTSLKTEYLNRNDHPIKLPWIIKRSSRGYIDDSCRSLPSLSSTRRRICRYRWLFIIFIIVINCKNLLIITIYIIYFCISIVKLYLILLIKIIKHLNIYL